MPNASYRDDFCILKVTCLETVIFLMFRKHPSPKEKTHLNQ
jgi:hypothetical protein